MSNLLQKWQIMSLIFVAIPTTFLFFSAYASNSPGSFGQGIYSGSEFGSDVLSHFNGVPHLIYDTEKQAGYRSREIENRQVFGFATVVNDGTAVVALVLDKSPASIAGMRQGDVIDSINGISVASTSKQVLNDTIDSLQVMTISLHRRDGARYTITLTKESTSIPKSLTNGYLDKSDLDDPERFSQATQDLLDDVEYEVNLAPRAVLFAIFGWLLVDVVFLILAAKALPSLLRFRRKHSVGVTLVVLGGVPVSLVLIVASSLLLPPLYTVLLMGFDNDHCGGFICIDPAPLLIAGGLIVLTLINVPLLLLRLRGKLK